VLGFYGMGCIYSNVIARGGEVEFHRNATVDEDRMKED
jgi:hypothetical protein